LDDIWKYFARVGSMEVADGLLREIYRTAERIRERPMTGRPREELASGLRSMLVHPHSIFYRMSEETVEIVRVLHQRRDLDAIFAPDRHT
jgi:toxin ParE1/3/4